MSRIALTPIAKAEAFASKNKAEYGLTYDTDTLLSPAPSINTNVGKVCQLSCPGMTMKTRTTRSPVCNPASPCENDGPDPYSLKRSFTSPSAPRATIGRPRFRSGDRSAYQLGDPRASTANLDYHDGVSRQRDMAYTAVRHRPSNMAKMSPKIGIDDMPSAARMKLAKNSRILSSDPVDAAGPDPYNAMRTSDAVGWQRRSIATTAMASRKPRFCTFGRDSERGYFGTVNIGPKNLADMFRFFNKR